MEMLKRYVLERKDMLSNAILLISTNILKTNFLSVFPLFFANFECKESLPETFVFPMSN